MTAFSLKIRDVFSDLWLEVELFFDRVFRHREKTPAAIVYSAPAAPTEARPVAAAKPKAAPAVLAKKSDKLPWSIRLLRLTGSGRLFFFDQMATLTGSGVSLIDALNLIRAQTRGSGMKQLYAEMIHRINAGVGLAETLRMFPHLFPRMQVALIEAGEKSGNLAVVLADIVEDMETGQDFLRKVKGAMFYPVILLFLAVTLVAGMMIFVIPRVASMYGQANVQLPRLTQVVIQISGFFQQYWVPLFGGIAAGVLLFWLFFSKVRIGQLLWEKIVRIIPVFGLIGKEKNLMVIASNMAMLLKSGVLISEAFEITEKTVDSLHYSRALAKIRHDVMMGQSVSESMGLRDIGDAKFRENKLFPLQFAQLVRIGETTGQISQMLTKLRANYHKSIDYKLKNISTMIEPIMIFFVAFFVGSIVLAVMLPFFYIGSAIG